MKALSKWIEVTGHFDHDTDGEFVYDCELPEDGQEILVTLIGGVIGRDICHIDKMGYHLESGWDWEDVFKWAPMPPAWWEETHEERTETNACDCISRQAAIDAILEQTVCATKRELVERCDANISDEN